MRVGMRWAWFLLLLFGATWTKAGVHNWTSVTGEELPATFAGVEGDQVILETEEGNKVVIRIHFLIPEDQVRIRELAVHGRDAGEDESGRKLPVLGRGLGKGHHAFYEHAHFDAWVADNGYLFIHPKEHGERVGQAFHLQPLVVERVAGRPSIRFDRFEEFEPPRRNPSVVTFRATGSRHGNEFSCRVEYQFNQNRVCASIEIVEPRRSERDYYAAMNYRFMPAVTLDPQMPQAERIKYLGEYQFRWRGGDHGWQDENFYDSRTLRGPLNEAIITGPWGRRTVKIEGENRRRGNNTRVWSYPGRPLNNGYRIIHEVELGNRAGNTCVIIE